MKAQLLIFEKNEQTGKLFYKKLDETGILPVSKDRILYNVELELNYEIELLVNKFIEFLSDKSPADTEKKYQNTIKCFIQPKS